VLRPSKPFNGVKVLSATTNRDQLGDHVTRWITEHPQYQVVEIVVSQSSDASFHCLAYSLFYWESLPKKT